MTSPRPLTVRWETPISTLHDGDGAPIRISPRGPGGGGGGGFFGPPPGRAPPPPPPHAPDSIATRNVFGGRGNCRVGIRWCRATPMNGAVDQLRANARRGVARRAGATRAAKCERRQRPGEACAATARGRPTPKVLRTLKGREDSSQEPSRSVTRIGPPAPPPHYTCMHI